MKMQEKFKLILNIFQDIYETGRLKAKDFYFKLFSVKIHIK